MAIYRLVSLLKLSFVGILCLFLALFLYEREQNMAAAAAAEEADSATAIAVTARPDSVKTPAGYAVSVAEGKRLFIQNCATCHARDMRTKATGPALAGVADRWAEYPRADLYAWIKNSQALVAQEHPRAKQLMREWNTVMNSFPALDEPELEAILAYIEVQSGA